MAQSLGNIFVHLTFSTYCRRLYLDENVREIVFPYLTGIMKNKNAAVLEIGGADDHDPPTRKNFFKYLRIRKTRLAALVRS